MESLLFPSRTGRIYANPAKKVVKSNINYKWEMFSSIIYWLQTLKKHLNRTIFEQCQIKLDAIPSRTIHLVLRQQSKHQMDQHESSRRRVETTSEDFSESDNILNLGFIASSVSSFNSSEHSLTISQISSIPYSTHRPSPPSAEAVRQEAQEEDRRRERFRFTKRQRKELKKEEKLQAREQSEDKQWLRNLLAQIDQFEYQ